MESAAKAVSNLIGNLNLFFLGSVDESGYPNIKAMLAPRKRDEIRTIYFTTATSSMKAIQYRKDPKASLYFCDPETWQGAMMTGEVEVLMDSSTKNEMWREGDELYHPLGVEDPDYCVLKFTSEKGRYYSELHSEDFFVE